MAVELAKLSCGWSPSPSGSPLTFLNHHMRCGDSLIGLWKTDLHESQTKLQRFTGELEAAGKALFYGVSQSHDLSLEELSLSRGLRASPTDDKSPGGAAGFAGILSP